MLGSHVGFLHLSQEFVLSVLVSRVSTKLQHLDSFFNTSKSFLSIVTKKKISEGVLSLIFRCNGMEWQSPTQVKKLVLLILLEIIVQDYIYLHIY